MNVLEFRLQKVGRRGEGGEEEGEGEEEQREGGVGEERENPKQGLVLQAGDDCVLADAMRRVQCVGVSRKEEPRQ